MYNIGMMDGGKIKRLRKKAGYSKRPVLAKELGTSDRTLQRIEKNEWKGKDDQLIFELIKKLKTTPEEIRFTPRGDAQSEQAETTHEGEEGSNLPDADLFREIVSITSILHGEDLRKLHFAARLIKTDIEQREKNQAQSS